MVIILRGPTAGGKNTIAYSLSKKTNFPIVDLDKIKIECDGTVYIENFEKQKNWFRVAGQRANEHLCVCKGVIIHEAYIDKTFINETFNQIKDKDTEVFVVQIKYALSEHMRRNALKADRIDKESKQIERFYSDYENSNSRGLFRNDLEISDPNLSAEEIAELIAENIGYQP